MVSDFTRVKVRLLIKSYLVMNQGRVVTGKHIADFINHNNFGLSGFCVDHSTVNRFIRMTNHKAQDLFRNVELIDGSPVGYRLPWGSK